MPDSIIATEPIWSDYDESGGSVLLYAPGDVIPGDAVARLGVTTNGTRVRKPYTPTVTETAAPEAPAKATARKGRTSRSKPTETREGTPE